MLGVTCAAAFTTGPASAAAEGLQVVTRIGYAAATPPFSNDDKRVRNPAKDPKDFGRSHHGVGFTLGVEVPLHPQLSLGVELAGTKAPLARPSILSQRLGAVWRVRDNLRLAGGVGFMQLFLGSHREGVGERTNIGPLVFVLTDLGLGRDDDLAEILTLQAEVMRVCNRDFGCSSWDGEPWVSERGFAWTMFTLSAMVGLRFD